MQGYVQLGMLSKHQRASMASTASYPNGQWVCRNKLNRDVRCGPIMTSLYLIRANVPKIAFRYKAMPSIGFL